MLEQMAKSAPGKPISQVKLLCRGKAPKILAAPTNYAKHVERCRSSATPYRACAVLADIEKAGIFLKSNTRCRPVGGIPMRFPESPYDHEAEPLHHHRQEAGISRKRRPMSTSRPIRSVST